MPEWLTAGFPLQETSPCFSLPVVTLCSKAPGPLLFCEPAWSLQNVVRDSSGSLFNKSSNRTFHHSSWDIYFFLFLCYELTAWISKVVILIDQSSNRELSASPASVESEIVPKLEKFPSERSDGEVTVSVGDHKCLPGPSCIYL